MSDTTTNNAKQSKSLLEQVAGQLKEQKRKAVAGQVKSHMEELLKAKAVCKGIEDKIIAELMEVGEGEDEIKAILESV